jgi:hypothetical protein
MVESSSAKPFMEFNEWHGRVYNLFLAEYKKRFPKRSLWVLHVPELREYYEKEVSVEQYVQHKLNEIGLYGHPNNLQ